MLNMLTLCITLHRLQSLKVLAFGMPVWLSYGHPIFEKYVQKCSENSPNLTEGVS